MKREIINSRNIKLVIFDLDGTLIDKSHSFREEDIERIEKLKNLGVFVSIATGRTFGSAKPYIETINPQVPVVICNGAAIVDASTEELLFVEKLPGDIVSEIITVGEMYNLSPIIYFDPMDGIPFIVKKTSDVLNFLDFEGLSEYNVISGDEVSKISAVVKLQLIGDKEQLDFYGKELLVKFQNIDVVPTKASYVEILPKGVSKGKAVEKMCSKLGIEMESVMSFGDSVNDADLLDISGVGVAISGSSEELERIADFSTESVAAILDELIESR